MLCSREAPENRGENSSAAAPSLPHRVVTVVEQISYGAAVHNNGVGSFVKKPACVSRLIEAQDAPTADDNN